MNYFGDNSNIYDNGLTCPYCGSSNIREIEESAFERGLKDGIMAGLFGFPGAGATRKTWYCFGCRNTFHTVQFHM